MNQVRVLLQLTKTVHKSITVQITVPCLNRIESCAKDISGISEQRVNLVGMCLGLTPDNM